jgi:biofilm PGA synthesis N-glycosyltransferase PgaC
MLLIHKLKNIIDALILIYALTIYISYFALTILAAFSLKTYLGQQKFLDHSLLLSSPLSPPISVLAPSYNESKTIHHNIKALLALHYNHFEVIIINDGSTDDSMNKIIEEYELEKSHRVIKNILPCCEIRGVYTSRNKSYNNLIVIDKINGGKADAMNAGLNLAQYDYFVAVDVDCIIENDALLKLIKPVLMAKKYKVIATGGAIRVANSCKMQDGAIVKVNFPTNFWARFQVLEYIRAFIIGRISWSKLNGLMLVSGALGLFDKKVVVGCGGYLTTTVGEDMELIIRMRRYMRDRKIDHRVIYIPDPLCWTEVPNSLKYLGVQRNRWTRGNMDSLIIHRKVFFNPKYGFFGMVTYPFYFFFEWLAPWAEVLGIAYFLVLSGTGEINWPVFFLLFSFVYLFSICISFIGILYEELSFKRYKNKQDLVNMYFTALLEPLIYHPLSLFWAIKGNLAFIKGEKKWGTMKRLGFKNA